MDANTINALAALRRLAIEYGGELRDTVDTLDNAEVFAAVDEANDYNVKSLDLWSLEDCFSEAGWTEVGKQEIDWMIKNF